MLFNDPAELENCIAPVAGKLSIRPAIGSVFSAEIAASRLEHTGLFTLSANSFHVKKIPQGEFYGLTIPLGAPFTVSERGRKHLYGSSLAHLLIPGRTFDLSAKSEAHFLVCNYFVNSLDDYSKKLLQSDTQDLNTVNPDISIFSQTGSDLLRSVANAWSVLSIQMPTNEITLTELEDNLLASIVTHINRDTEASGTMKIDDPRRLNRAEDFIFENLDQPITRDRLAEISSCSIRTLSRSFVKKYGIGPMALIKQRRLNAAYLDLLSSKQNESSVTRVALNYGFAHPGKFAIEYGKAFGETPSTSLAR